MPLESPAASKPLSLQGPLRPRPNRDRPTPAEGMLRLQRGLLFLAAALGVVLIALLDNATESRLSISFLYLLPVTACAWSCGFSHGILLSLGGSVAWHMVDSLENPALPPAVRVWNGVLRFGTLALMASLVSRLRISIVRERLLARTDALTGAANGRTFYETAMAEAERARRAERPMTLAYFDLDNFKQLNDRLGHAVGDEALRCVVQTMHLHLRSTDLLARLGGDEFALLLPETGAEGAAALLARLQENLSRELRRKGWPVTLSVGAVTFIRPLADIDLMVQRVDALMYGAKRMGKDRVEHTVVTEAEALADPRPGIDRRATARMLSNRTARVRREGEEQEAFAAVCDVSSGGIALQMEHRFPADAVLLVEPLASGGRALLARVKHCAAAAPGWRHGCELSSRLSPEELRFWIGEGEDNAECRMQNKGA